MYFSWKDVGTLGTVPSLDKLTEYHAEEFGVYLVQSPHCVNRLIKTNALTTVPCIIRPTIRRAVNRIVQIMINNSVLQSREMRDAYER